MDGTQSGNCKMRFHNCLRRSFLKKIASLFCSALGSVLLLIIFLVGNSAPAFATGPVVTGTEVVPLTILGGALTGVVGPAVPPVNTTLLTSTQSPTYTIPVTITDLTGSGAGWNLTITSTQFTTGGATPATLSTTASTITSVAVTCTVGCTTPTNSITYPLSVPAGATAPTAVKFFNAALNTGMGESIITPTISISVPPTTYTGVYSSTVTVSLVSGP